MARRLREKHAQVENEDTDDANPYWFPGKIDDVQIYNRALSAADILAQYNAGGNGVCPTPKIGVSPTARDFGNVNPGKKSSQTFTITSSEGLRNLFDMIGPLGQAWLRKTPLFVPHSRIAEQAVALGLKNVVLTGAADDGLMNGLIAYFAKVGKHHD